MCYIREFIWSYWPLFIHLLTHISTEAHLLLCHTVHTQMIQLELKKGGFFSPSLYLYPSISRSPFPPHAATPPTAPHPTSIFLVQTCEDLLTDSFLLITSGIWEHSVPQTDFTQWCPRLYLSLCLAQVTQHASVHFYTHICTSVSTTSHHTQMLWESPCVWEHVHPSGLVVEMHIMKLHCLFLAICCMSSLQEIKANKQTVMSNYGCVCLRIYVFVIVVF